MSKWHTSIKELLLNYKGALQSLIPWLEKSKIPYKEGETYDDWESICNNLYEKFVINSILYSEKYDSTNSFAKYDFQYQNYKDLNFILCENPIGKNELSIFVSFSTENDFEMIHTCNAVKDNLNVISRDMIKLSDAKFYLNQKIPLENIVVEI